MGNYHEIEEKNHFLCNCLGTPGQFVYSDLHSDPHQDFGVPC
jgi:hypothetical protein